MGDLRATATLAGWTPADELALVAGVFPSVGRVVATVSTGHIDPLPLDWRRAHSAQDSVRPEIRMYGASDGSTVIEKTLLPVAAGMRRAVRRSSLVTHRARSSPLPGVRWCEPGTTKNPRTLTSLCGERANGWF